MPFLKQGLSLLEERVFLAGGKGVSAGRVVGVRVNALLP